MKGLIIPSVMALSFTFMATVAFSATDEVINKTAVQTANEFTEHVHNPIEVNYANQAITLDGMPDELDWQQAKWHPIDQMIIGDDVTADDFSGQYKLLWRENKLYLLTEIIDDVLFDQTADPTVLYWDDDTVEVFLDEDASGGNHQYSHNAFAYHVALDRQVADFTTQKKAATFNEHITTVWSRDPINPKKMYWEMAINIFPDSYDDSLSAFDEKQVAPVTLQTNKKMGFMLAYCDNDGAKTRENFIGSHPIKPLDGDMNRGYKHADVFGSIILKAPK
ncbi:sugar-binding protein [Shewanella donghaensis]|uniref:sugar-binding protein n=1 Tax=Shewanella donghaensis TaxID=238836 RepID=UPI001315185E|nr:sugar-binding protein [Shewanella donghaensis]